MQRIAQTRDIAYDFLKQNRDTLVAKLPPTSVPFFLLRGNYCDPSTGDAEPLQGPLYNTTADPHLSQVLEASASAPQTGRQPIERCEFLKTIDR